MILYLIESLGLLGIFLIIFAESGLFFGFFLPGDSLLFTAGLLASASHFNLFYLLFGCFICAVLGDNVGYWTGKKLGPKIFSKPDSFFFSKKNLEKTEKFYREYGKKTIILARFAPIIRTFAPILAGASKMHYGNFIFYNFLGGFLWIFILILSGYFLGGLVKDIDQYILPITLIIIFFSFFPIVVQFLKERKKI